LGVMTNADKREYIELTAMKIDAGWDAAMRGRQLIEAMLMLMTEHQLSKLDVEKLMDFR